MTDFDPSQDSVACNYLRVMAHVAQKGIQAGAVIGCGLVAPTVLALHKYKVGGQRWGGMRGVLGGRVEQRCGGGGLFSLQADLMRGVGVLGAGVEQCCGGGGHIRAGGPDSGLRAKSKAAFSAAAQHRCRQCALQGGVLKDAAPKLATALYRTTLTTAVLSGARCLASEARAW